MSKFEDLMTALATSADQQFATAEEIQEMVNDYTGKAQQIETLKADLESRNSEYEALKNRIVEHLFSNPKGEPQPEPEPEEPKQKSFKDIVNPQFSIRNH